MHQAKSGSNRSGPCNCHRNRFYLWNDLSLNRPHHEAELTISSLATDRLHLAMEMLVHADVRPVLSLAPSYEQLWSIVTISWTAVVVKMWFRQAGWECAFNSRCFLYNIQALSINFVGTLVKNSSSTSQYTSNSCFRRFCLGIRWRGSTAEYIQSLLIFVPATSAPIIHRPRALPQFLRRLITIRRVQGGIDQFFGSLSEPWGKRRPCINQAWLWFSFCTLRETSWRIWEKNGSWIFGAWCPRCNSREGISRLV